MREKRHGRKNPTMTKVGAISIFPKSHLSSDFKPILWCESFTPGARHGEGKEVEGEPVSFAHPST